MLVKNAKKPSKKILLQPDPKHSLFKIKLYYADGGEHTMFGRDFQHERDQFDNLSEADIVQGYQKHGSRFFSGYNGFMKLKEVLDNTLNDGLLKVGFLYHNQMYGETPNGFMPKRLLTVDQDGIKEG